MPWPPARSSGYGDAKRPLSERSKVAISRGRTALCGRPLMLLKAMPVNRDPAGSSEGTRLSHLGTREA